MEATDPEITRNEADALDGAGSASRTTVSGLMGQRLYLHTYVRLAVSIVIVGGALFATHVIGVETLDVGPLVALAGVIAGYNALAYYYTRRHRQRRPSPEVQRRLRLTMYATTLLDFVALTAAIWLVGGARSPFLAFYLLHLILSCVFLTPRAATTLSAVAFGLLVVLVVGEWSAVLHPRLPAGAVSGQGPIDGRYAVTILVVYGMLIGLVIGLLTSLMGQLRRGEQRLRKTRAEMERLSNMRRDFLHIAVHDLRSPIGVTTMFLEHMRAGLGGPITEQQERWIDKCLRRMNGLTSFLQEIQTLAALEAGELDAQRGPVDMREVIHAVVNESTDLAHEHGHRIEVEVPEDLPRVRGIGRLLHEAVANYVTNAIKYTPRGGHIRVRARAADGVIRIEVEDNGIGIGEEDRQRLFGEFFRARRDHAEMLDVEGTGLGLSIVSRVAKTHGGRVGVTSEPGHGSTFFLEIPIQ